MNSCRCDQSYRSIKKEVFVAVRARVAKCRPTLSLLSLVAGDMGFISDAGPFSGGSALRKKRPAHWPAPNVPVSDAANGFT